MTHWLYTALKMTMLWQEDRKGASSWKARAEPDPSPRAGGRKAAYDSNSYIVSFLVGAETAYLSPERIEMTELKVARHQQYMGAQEGERYILYAPLNGLQLFEGDQLIKS